MSNIRSNKSTDIGGGRSAILAGNSIEAGAGRNERRQQRGQEGERWWKGNTMGVGGEVGTDAGKDSHIREGPATSGVMKVVNSGMERKDPSKAQ